MSYSCSARCIPSAHPFQMFQRQVVTHSEHPTMQIRPRFASPQVLEKRQECFVHNFLAFVRGNAEGQYIAQQRIPQPAEQSNNLFLVGAAIHGSCSC